jgi:hypothetical protein
MINIVQSNFVHSDVISSLDRKKFPCDELLPVERISLKSSVIDFNVPEGKG